MIRMIKADLYRLVKSKGFYIYWAITIFTLGLAICLKSPGGLKFGADAIYAEKFKLDVEQMGCNFTFIYLFVMPVYSIIVNDFSHRTVKNTLSSAISRKMYYISKFVLTEVYIFVSFMVSVYAFYGINALVNGKEYTSPIGEFTEAVLNQLPIMMGTVALFIMLAFVIKKAAVFNAITLISPFLYISIALAIHQSGGKAFAEKYLLKYELTGALSNLVHGASGEYVLNCGIIGAVLFVGSLALGYITFTRFEIE